MFTIKKISAVVGFCSLLMGSIHAQTNTHNHAPGRSCYAHDKLQEQLQFLEDATIPKRVVNKTCERCPILDCQERVAHPTVIENREKRKRIQKTLEKL